VDQEEGYYEQGVAFLSRGVFSLGLDDARPRSWRAPLFPAFAALSELPFPTPNPWHLRLAQQALSVLGIALAFWLGALAAGPWAALAGASLLALDPEQILSANSLNVHAFYGLGLLGLAGAGALWAQKPERRRGALLGAAFGATLLTRSAHFLSVPLVLGIGAWRGDGWRKAAERAAWPLAVLAAMLAPWTLRNAIQFGRFAPLDANRASVNFYAASLGDMESSTVMGAMRRAEAERPGIVALTERDWDPAFLILLELARRHVRENPLRYAQTTWERTRLLYGAWWPALLAAGYGLWRRRSSRAALAAGAVGASLAAYGLVGVQPNYVDTARPLLAVLLGWGLVSIVDTAGGRAEKPGAAPTAAAWGAAAFAAILAAALLLADGLVLREPLLARLRSDGTVARAESLGDGRADALSLLLRRRATRPGDADAAALARRGTAAFLAGDAKGAEALLSRAQALAPGDPEIALSLGVCLDGRGARDRAEAEYSRAAASALSTSPVRAEIAAAALSSRADLRARRGRRAAARADLEKALELAPADWSERGALQKRLEALAR
jgi:tetratricopeptide (TPR) repeat protein